jgi:hypothetical protein
MAAFKMCDTNLAEALMGCDMLIDNHPRAECLAITKWNAERGKFMRLEASVGLKVFAFSGIGPGPFYGPLLSDMGVDVRRIDRHGYERASTIRDLKRCERDNAIPREAAHRICLVHGRVLSRILASEHLVKSAGLYSLPA